MASDEEDLRINTLHALSKHSPTLVLEENGNCEVPAGCGGVVLRWRDPSAGTPGILRVASLGVVRAWLDGVETTSTWLTLAAGRHVLALELSKLPEAPSPLMVVFSGEAVGAEALAHTTVGSDWRVHTSPTEGWCEADFDDAAWAVSSSADNEVAALADDQSWRFRRLTDLGAAAIRVEGPTCVVRGRFEIGGAS